MAGRISDVSLNAVREKASIVDVVGAVVALKSAGGGQLKGLCPFHDEKSPSFSVNPASNVFHCFGCGVGGDVITFVRQLDGLTFSEAVERLAGRFGVALTYEGGGSAAHRETGKRQRLIEACHAAAQFYAEQLRTPEAQIGRQFLDARGFDAAAAERFGVGFAPSGWDTLTRHLRGRGYSVDELVEAGLAKQGRNGPIDRFHRRLLWPIRDTTGDVVGFGARRLHDDDPIAAKYLNTPETALFKKSHLLYGADLARRSIAQRYQAVIVEGYTDVMACHLAGVETAVATCGTSFGEEHVKLLRRLLHDQDESRGEVVFTFDGDAAGKNAALRALQFDERFVGQTFVAIEPDGRDPCELRQAAGDAAVRELVAARVPLVEFAVRATVDTYDLDSIPGRANALRAASPMVAGLKDRTMRDAYARRLAGWLGFPPEEVVDKVRELAGEAPVERDRATGRAAPRPRQPARKPDDMISAAEREALKTALQYPALAGPAFDALDLAYFTVAEHRQLRGAIAAAGGVCTATDVPSWIAAVGSAAGPQIQQLVTALAVEPLRYDGEDLHRYVSSVVDRIQELHVTRRIAEVKARVQRLNPVTEQDSFSSLFGELIALEERKRQLRERGLGAA